MGYKILIADDEEKITRLICELGHWEELGISIVAICSDGEEAVNKILELQPDIVLTDIKMPVMDGIQMIEYVLAKGVNTNFIVLSGYKYFEYARNAIQLGVVDYLLKPLDEEELNQALLRTCNKINAQRDQNVQKAQLEKYVERDRYDAHQEFWQVLLERRTSSIPAFQDIQSCNETYQTSFERGLFQSIYITTNIDSLLSGQESLFSEKVRESCNKLFDEHYHYVYRAGKSGLYLIVNYGKEQTAEIKRIFSALYYNIRSLSEIYGDFTLFMGASDVCEDICDLEKIIEQSEIAAFGKFVFGGAQVVEYDMLKRLQRFQVRDILPQQLENELCGYVRTFQFEDIGQAFRELDRKAVSYQNAYPGDMRGFFYYLLDLLVPIHYEREKDAWDMNKKQIILDIKSARSFTQMIKVFYNSYNQILHKRLEELEQKKGKPIEDAKRYIREHFAEQISLEEIAERTQFSPAYFSKLFKAQVSVGFNEYLTQVRIEEAKRLLLESNHSMKEIAHLVGYADDKHFLKTFKKMVGISPKDYRKLYAG